MKVERGSISSNDLMFAVFCFMQATVLRSGYIISVTRQDSWAMAITGFLFSLSFMAIYAMLLQKFPGKNLFEIDNIVLGPIFGKIISALYLFFFVSLAALNTRDLGNFVIDYMMPETPIAAVIVVFLIGCAYSIHKGIKNLMQLSTMICIVTVVAVIINTILVLKDIEPGFLKPLFQLEPIKYVKATVSVGAVPMGEILAFMMLTPMLGKDTKAAKPFLFGLILSTISMVIVILRDIVILGPLVSIVSLPSFESVRYISVSGVLTRMESIYAVILIFLFLFKTSILLYAFALGLTQILSQKSSLPVDIDTENQACETGRLLRQKSYPPLLLVSTALVLFYSLFVFESVMENMDWGATTAPFFSLTFELLLPAITLLTAYIQKRGSPREVKA
ncbi:putative Spore germination protein, amino acid permease [uncultured Eubacteriales bacterium]|uniref:Putative Spore germination protein, amino acid permease n=1 Tax=uncultured Eubacteriales bacterium TaxID=172733 RepID=A0A212KC39_9FIRM|nr:putative Spore germination protein, amino acid permease [uncultured Eubacteriales bacterium]